MNKNKENKKETTGLQPSKVATSLAPIPPTNAVTPFGFMRRFAEEMDHLFNEMGGFRMPSLFTRELPFFGEPMKADWAPKVEVMRHNGDMTVRAELPGLSKDDVHVEVSEEALALSGERHEEKEEKRDGYYRTERSYGSFYRRIPLPEGADLEHVKANFKDGLLEVTMPVFKPEPKTRKIEVQTGAKTAAQAV